MKLPVFFTFSIRYELNLVQEMSIKMCWVTVGFLKSISEITCARVARHMEVKNASPESVLRHALCNFRSGHVSLR